MDLTEEDLKVIIESVMTNVEAALADKEENQSQRPIQMKQISVQERPRKSIAQQEEKGVFTEVKAAVAAAAVAQKQLMKDHTIIEREAMIAAIRKNILAEKEALANLVYEETKLGNLKSKLAKLELVCELTPGTEDLKTYSFTGANGLTFVENAPYGVVGAVTPVTNPIDTIINNTIGLVAAGNSIVFNVHPGSVQSCMKVVQMINEAIQSEGGPANVVTMVRKPTMDSLKEIIASPEVKLLVGTGGPGMVKTLLQSGKKAIGAGAGNPPVIIDETADLKKAAEAVIAGASFDNNLLCIAEKEVFVLDEVADEFIFEMLSAGAQMLNRHQVAEVMDFALVSNENNIRGGCSYKRRNYLVAKEWIGQDAQLFLEKLNIPHQQPDLLICEVDFNHPFVQLEQMMPILPIVRVKDLEEAIELAVKAEHGNRHTAIMHSKNLDAITKFAKAIETTLFITNAPSLAGVGYLGEGHTTMTIAGPTGEGVTSAKTFTRQRRTVIADGGLNIIG